MLDARASETILKLFTRKILSFLWPFGPHICHSCWISKPDVLEACLFLQIPRVRVPDVGHESLASLEVLDW